MVYFKLEDLNREEFKEFVGSYFRLFDTIIFINKNNSVKVKLGYEDFVNQESPILMTLSEYPQTEFTFVMGQIEGSLFDCKDPFAYMLSKRTLEKKCKVRTIKN